MTTPFVKMHGAGNDFVVLDARSGPIDLNPEQAALLADRHLGIGCDQILIVDNAPDADLAYRILNSDGSMAQQCGNGARCIASYAWSRSSLPDVLQMRSPAGIVTARRDGHRVAVQMSVPITEPADIPFIAESESTGYAIDVSAETFSAGVVSMGNPHAILFADSWGDHRVASLGAALSKHSRFPEGVNVGFASIQARDAIHLRVYERGAGETLACGSGACAAVVAGCLQEKLDAQVEVALPGGNLGIYWGGPGQPVTMAGPSTFVFEGTIEL